MKKSEIKFIVGLDEKNIPEKIEWVAEDSLSQDLKETKSISLSLWDEEKKNTLRIDLWTKEMPVNEMNNFFYQSILTMGESIYRATENEKVKNAMKKISNILENELKIEVK
mgnify:CR=1 FL=1